MAAKVDANNRQLHPTEYQIAKDHAKLVAKKLGITEEEAEGRIVRQLQRNMDGATAQQDGERRDEPIISILGCGLLKCDAKTTDPHYWDTTYNTEYIKPNQSSYDKGKAQSGAGMTPQQIEERNNRAGAPLAKGGAVLLGGYVLLPAAAAIGTELVAFARNPVVYCATNPAACVGAADVAAGTAAGVPVTGVPVPHGVPNAGAGGKVGAKELSASNGLITDVRAIGSEEANAPFLARGWSAPYDGGSQVRTFQTTTEIRFVRVSTAENPQGAFLVRPDDIAGMTPEQIQQYLALPKAPTQIADVTVPAGTRMQSGRVAAQPTFGVPSKGGVQYQLVDQIPSSSFGNPRSLK